MVVRRIVLFAGAATMLTSLTASSVAWAKETYIRPPYGCFRVETADLNIREKPFAASGVVAVAGKGQVLIKSKRFCNWRGYFCAVEYDTGSKYIQGYADKNFLAVVPCPADLARRVD